LQYLSQQFCLPGPTTGFKYQHNPMETLTLESTRINKLGNAYYRFQQTYHNIPVAGQEIIVSANRNKLGIL
jgi:Zn-dependent metalloprotease